MVKIATFAKPRNVSGNLNKTIVKKITLFLFTAILVSCVKQKKEDEKVILSSEYNLLKYIQKPKSDDSLCIDDIQKAKKDISKGKLVFCYPMGFGTHQFRSEKQLIQLCKKYNIVFDYEMHSDVITEGQTQGCYGAYMDKKIAEKFGHNFKKQLLNQADSILLASNDTIEYYLCDKRPHLPGKNDYETNIDAKLDSKLKKQLKADEEGDLPFMDIGFYIDKNGIPSGYFLNYFNDKDILSNKKLEDKLFKESVELLKKYNYWETGQIKGQKVVTENNARIYF